MWETEKQSREAEKRGQRAEGREGTETREQRGWGVHTFHPEVDGSWKRMHQKDPKRFVVFLQIRLSKIGFCTYKIGRKNRLFIVPLKIVFSVKIKKIPFPMSCKNYATHNTPFGGKGSICA
jgi:hypothetical protein